MALKAICPVGLKKQECLRRTCENALASFGHQRLQEEKKLCTSFKTIKLHKIWALDVNPLVVISVKDLGLLRVIDLKESIFGFWYCLEVNKMISREDPLVHGNHFGFFERYFLP